MHVEAVFALWKLTGFQISFCTKEMVVELVDIAGGG